MTTMKSDLKMNGRLTAKLIRNGVDAPLSWKLKNRVAPRFWFNWATWHLAKGFSKMTGIATLTGSLQARLIKADGTYIAYGTVAYGLVTTAFQEFMVDQLQAETTEWGDFKFHDSGVGVTAAAIGDTDIETTDGESRATGSQTENGAGVYRSVGTISYTTTKAITEHGLFSKATGTTLMDRHTFTAINVVNGDSIEFTYDLTVNSGG